MRDPSDHTIILHLLRGPVPERTDEICGLWNRYSAEIEVASNAQGITMNADAKRIRIDTKTIDYFWLVGFSVWKALEVYLPAVTLSTLKGCTLDEALVIDEDRGALELEYRQRFASVSRLLETGNLDAISRPEDVPEPTADRESLESVEAIAAFDLEVLVLAFTFLHEFRHVMFLSEGNMPSTLVEEEIACDNRAREFMTRRLGDYAQANGHEFAEVQQKRAAGIALAAFAIHGATPEHDRWGSSQYLPFGERLTSMMGGFSLPDTFLFWQITACYLVSVAKARNRPLDIVASSSREMSEELLRYLL